MPEPTTTQDLAAAKLAARAEASPFLVQIGEVYEGPFDLLLDLIRRQNVSIYDIPIAAITTEYLRYLDSLRDLDVEVASEFLVVAATLIQIKSKMMLPADPLLPGCRRPLRGSPGRDEASPTGAAQRACMQTRRPLGVE